MIQIEGVTGWHITQIDQSIAASDIRNDRPRSTRAVRIMAQAHGPRYDRWQQAVRDNDEDAVDAIVIHACVYAPTFERAMVAMQDEIAGIEATNPY
jgi:hypothetical protein